jgi:hypothetical protein
MQIKHAGGAGLSPRKYAELIGRSGTRMPTALGKPAWRCFPEDLRRLDAWHAEVAALFGRLEDGARAGVAYKLSSEEQALIRRYHALQRALWRWALGVDS